MRSTYTQRLVAGWKRREWLSVLVIATTTAFLIGTVLLLVTAGSYASTVEGDLSRKATVEYVGSAAPPQQAAGTIRVSVAQVRTETGRVRYVVGIPQQAPAVIPGASVEWKQAGVPQAPESGLAGPVAEPTIQTLEGRSTQREVRVVPHGEADSIFPSWWYVARPTMVEQLGTTGSLVIDPQQGAQVSAKLFTQGVPLVAAFPFLLLGLRDILQTLGIAAVSGGMLVVVLVYSVIQLAIQDRQRTIRIARSTGATPRQILLPLVVRGGLLAGIGVLLGYAIGIVATNAVVNAAVFFGLPVSLNPTVTAMSVPWLLGIVGFLWIAGLLAGFVATLPAVRRPPQRLGDRSAQPLWPSSTRIRMRHMLRDWLQLDVLSWRALVPTVPTLTVFVLTILLVGAITGAIAPLATTSGGTIVESGAAHPLNSRIDPGYAEHLRANGVNASPEIIHAQVNDGRAFVVRGANFSALSSVTETHITRGRAPQAPDEAIIGQGLAQTLDVQQGETITLGGSVSPGIRRVTIVGMFTGSSLLDDQLVVPLQTVSGLATGGQSVHLIRTTGTGTLSQNDTASVVVSSIDAPDKVTQGESFNTTVIVRNLGQQRVTTPVTLTIGTRQITRDVTALPSGTTTMTIAHTPTRTGSLELTAGNLNHTVSVVDPMAFVIPDSYPTEAPPGAAIVVPTVTANETPVGNATVVLEDQSTRSSPRGTAIMSIPDTPGTYTLTVRKPGYQPARYTIEVRQDAERKIAGQIAVSPTTGNALTRPTVTVTVANPWGSIQTRNLTLRTPSGEETRRVSLTGGNVSLITRSASELGFPERLAPGVYRIQLLADGELIATATYRVRDDPRVTAAIATTGAYASGTGLGRAIENIFGNVQVMFAAIIALAGLGTVGSTTAAFVREINARRQAIGIYRATGATPRAMLLTLVSDAVTLALPASMIALILAYLIIGVARASGLLVIFGIRLPIPQTLSVLVGTVIGSILLATLSVAAAGYWYLRSSPVQLLYDD